MDWDHQKVMETHKWIKQYRFECISDTVLFRALYQHNIKQDGVCVLRFIPSWLPWVDSKCYLLPLYSAKTTPNILHSSLPGPLNRLRILTHSQWFGSCPHCLNLLSKKLSPLLCLCLAIHTHAAVLKHPLDIVRDRFHVMRHVLVGIHWQPVCHTRYTCHFWYVAWAIRCFCSCKNAED